MVSKHSPHTFTLSLWIGLAFWSFSLMANAASSSEEVRRRFEALSAGFPVTARQQPLLAVDALMAFYEDRRFELAWFEDSRLRPEAKDLLRTIDRSAGEGLQPGDYHQQAIASLIGDLEPSSPVAMQIDLDLLLSDAFLLLGSHLLAGKVNPETVVPEWTANRRGLDMAPLLAQALEAGSVEAMLDTLRPSQATYQQLREERKRLVELLVDEDWKTIAPGRAIRPNDKDPRLPLVRSRLVKLGDQEPGAQDKTDNSLTPADDSLYDVQLLAAVSRFQRRHGLEPDGIIGPGTLAALNIPLTERLQQVELNMERWRWLPEQLGSPHVMVNMAGSEIQIMVDRQPIRQKSLTVGSECQDTPPFSDEIRYLVFNPAWILPPALAVRDRPSQITDPARLKRLGFRVYTGWGIEQSEVNPATVDWSNAFGDHSPYQFVQSPGPHNVLGQVKIMFPNQYGLYLHGAASEDAFKKPEGLFAHGCIRVEGPLELVDMLLGEEPGWSHQRVKKIDGQSQTLYLQEPMRIHVQYLTNWADEDGLLQVRKDIFGRDPALAKALDRPPG